MQNATTKPKVKLTPKETLFCEHYVVSFNASDAAKKAGYSEKTARGIGYENLTKPHIKSYIKQRTDEILAEVGVNQIAVIKELSKIAYLNPKNFFDARGNVLPIDQLPDEVASCISGFENEEIKLGAETIGSIKKVKFVSKEGALNTLLRYMGIANDKVSVSAKIKEDPNPGEGKTFEVSMEL